jgi:REP element-mobilizing transposase RayT
MKRVPRQAVLPFGRKESVLNRQIRERALGKKVRRGPGRPPKNEGGRVAHHSRPNLAGKAALHVTLKTRSGVPNLRTRRRFNIIKHAFVKFCGARASDGRAIDGFRLVHFAVLSNHLHLVVEADSKRVLSMGMQKLLHSISRRLNALSVHERGGKVSTRAGRYNDLDGWLGRVFADRYHAHHLKTPTEMNHAVNYVLTNAERHGASRANYSAGFNADAFSSIGALTFDMPRPELPLVAQPEGVLLARACQALLERFGL